MRVVGLGTQSELGDAEAFFDDFGPFTFPMYWDPSGESWSAFGVLGQPALALLRPGGSLVQIWPGELGEISGLLETIAQL